MEEKEEKDKSRKSKSKDLIKKDKEQKEQKSNNKINQNLPDKYFKFDITYKNKELNKFKDEILSYLRNRDYYFIEKLKNLKSQADITDKNLDNLSEVMNKNFSTILSTQAEANTKLDKLKIYDAFVNKANDKLISHEIRINCLREDLTKTTQKYDKIYLDNLEVPGYIGRCSKYANCKIFFTDIIKEMDKFNTYREKNIIDLCTYKERLENIIKMFQNLVDNNNDSQIKYITQLNDKTNKNLLEIIEEKISNVRVNNSKFSIDLLNKTSEINELYEKINSIKEFIIKEFDLKIEELNKKAEETNNNFEDYKIEYAIIRKKFLELAEFIKSGKFSRNFGPIFGKKDINLMAKKLAKDNRDAIEAKDIKLLDNIEEIEKMEFKHKKNAENKNNNNNTNNNNANIYNINPNFERMSKSQNNFYINNNNRKKKQINFNGNGNNNNTNSNVEKHDINRHSVDNNNNNQMQVHHGVLYYLDDNNTSRGNSQKNSVNKNNMINEKDKKTVKNCIIPLEKTKVQEKKISNDNKEKKNDDIIDIMDKKVETVQKDEKKNTFTDDLSMSESYISNINNSINTFSTTNDKNNSLNSLINVNNNKCNKFNLFEEDLHHKDKVIKELASELEQSTAKANKLASNKKQIEDNFKNICNKIVPMNLKLNNLPMEQIPEQKNISQKDKDKDKDNNITDKSDQNTTLLSHNINNTNNTNNNNNTKSNITINENLNKPNKTRNSKLKNLIETKEKIDNNNNSIKSNKSKKISKVNNTNETLLNETINFSIDKKMNVYDKKIGDLELFTQEQISEIVKQINILKKTFTYIVNNIKKEKNLNAAKLGGFSTSNNNIFEQFHGNAISFNNNTNNENKNTLNLTGNNFHKKSLKNEINTKFGFNPKIIQTMDDINFRDNLFYNGKYYFNIKDIFDKNKSNANFNIENKKLLKLLDSKISEDNGARNRSNSSCNRNLKNNISSQVGITDNKWVDLRKLTKSKTQKPQSGIPPSSLLASQEQKE